MRGIHRPDKIEELRADFVETLDYLAVEIECHALMIGDESCVKNLNIVAIEAENGTIDSVGDGLAVGDGGEGVWVGHFEWLRYDLMCFL